MSQDLQSQVHLRIDAYCEEHAPSLELNVDTVLAPGIFDFLRSASRSSQSRLLAYKAISQAEEAFYERIKVAEWTSVKRLLTDLRQKHNLGNAPPAKPKMMVMQADPNELKLNQGSADGAAGGASGKVFGSLS